VRYAHFAKICDKCVNMRNMRPSHIRVKLASLPGGVMVGSFTRDSRSQVWLSFVHLSGDNLWQVVHTLVNMTSVLQRSASQYSLVLVEALLYPTAGKVWHHRQTVAVTVVNQTMVDSMQRDHNHE